MHLLKEWIMSFKKLSSLFRVNIILKMLGQVWEGYVNRVLTRCLGQGELCSRQGRDVLQVCHSGVLLMCSLACHQLLLGRLGSAEEAPNYRQP